jgi:hypothetical protein
MPVAFDWSVMPGPGNLWELFNVWRRNYDVMTLQEQIDFHSEFYKRWTIIHQHGDDGPVLTFFGDTIENQPTPARVLEIGGWTGDAAKGVLSRYQNIQEWRNIEICAEAVATPVTNDARYSGEVPTTWVWDQEFPGYTVLFMQHVLEHMKMAQFEKLLDKCPDAEYVFLQSPLEYEAWDWQGYPGCHIFDGGWNDVDLTMERHGYTLVQSWWDTDNSSSRENGRTRIYKRLTDD